MGCFKLQVESDGGLKNRRVENEGASTLLENERTDVE